MRPDVLIVGGGLVGALLARLLENLDLSIMLAEARPPFLAQGHAASAEKEGAASTPRGDDKRGGTGSRVYALSPGSCRLLEEVGAWNAQIEERSGVYQQMRVWDAQGSEAVSFQAENAGFTELGYIVSQSDILKPLWEGMDAQENLELLTGERLEGLAASSSGPRVSFASGLEVSPKLLIAADGAGSTVRYLADFQLWYRDYQQRAITTTLRFAEPHEQIARQVFQPQGTLALLPLRNNHECALVWSLNSSEADRVQALNDQDFSAAVEQAAEVCMGAAEILEPRQAFPLHRVLVRNWVKPGITLVGDAAHSLHPLAGQGLNLGFADARTLAEILVEASANGFQDIGKPGLLRRYQIRRFPVALSAVAILEAFQAGFQIDHPQPVFWRNKLMRLVNDSELVKSRIIRLASGEI